MMSSRLIMLLCWFAFSGSEAFVKVLRLAFHPCRSQRALSLSAFWHFVNILTNRNADYGGPQTDSRTHKGEFINLLLK